MQEANVFPVEDLLFFPEQKVFRDSAGISEEGENFIKTLTSENFRAIQGLGVLELSAEIFPPKGFPMFLLSETPDSGRWRRVGHSGAAYEVMEKCPLLKIGDFLVSRFIQSFVTDRGVTPLTLLVYPDSPDFWLGSNVVVLPDPVLGCPLGRMLTVETAAVYRTSLNILGKEVVVVYVGTTGNTITRYAVAQRVKDMANLGMVMEYSPANGFVRRTFEETNDSGDVGSSGGVSQGLP